MANKYARKALSVRQPWAWLLVHGYKDVENRTWFNRFRGECLIHAGRRFDQDGYNWVRRSFPRIKMPKPSVFELGGIVGWVEIADCVTESSSPWFFGPYGYLIGESEVLPFRPLRGRLKFFEIPMLISVSVRVEPDKLWVDDEDTGAVTVSVLDEDEKPVRDVSLKGKTKPSYLGMVSDLEDTDSSGLSSGFWYAGHRSGKGLLIVTVQDGAQAEAEIELVKPPKPPKPRPDKEEPEEPEEPEEEEEQPKPKDVEDKPDHPDGHDNSQQPSITDDNRPDGPTQSGGSNTGTTGGRTPHFGADKRNPLPNPDDDDDDDGDDFNFKPGKKNLGSGG